MNNWSNKINLAHPLTFESFVVPVSLRLFSLRLSFAHALNYFNVCLFLGELIGALAQKQGPVVYEESKQLLLTLIQKGLENDSNVNIEGDSAQQVDFILLLACHQYFKAALHI